MFLISNKNSNIEDIEELNSNSLNKRIKYRRRDGKIRTVRLKTQHGKMLRPIQRIYPLEIRSNENLQRGMEESIPTVSETLSPDEAIVEIHSIKTVSGDSVYHELLRKFPDITKPPRPDQEIKHSVVHYIETNSRPVTAKARRLAPDRLRIAKAEFENMITLGHMRPSKSKCLTFLHMVPKKRQHRVATSRRLPCTQCSNY
ncbi:transposon Ty3-I Gag-Pol polyprotein [Trichonephila clavipes]|nr:transposon Ty3-I Gag-Pol polyprotein [Trichonephila clavipes]